MWQKSFKDELTKLSYVWPAIAAGTVATGGILGAGAIASKHERDMARAQIDATRLMEGARRFDVSTILRKEQLRQQTKNKK